MFNKRTLAVIKRELKDRLMSRTFIFMTLLLPVLMFGLIGLQTALFSYEGNAKVNITIISETPELTQNFQKIFSDEDFVKKGNYNITYETMDKAGLDNYLQEKKDDILKESINGVIYIPETALKDKKIQYYSKTPKNFNISDKLRGPINKVLVESYFSGKNISEEEMNYAREGVDFTGYKVSKDEKIAEEGYGNLVLSYLFTFLLYISLLMMGSMVMQSVIEEKNNRIIEVLLSSVNSKELMTGKILGASITGLLQMTIWLIPVMMIISTSIFVLPAEFMFDLKMTQVLYLLLNFFVGLVTFLGLFATVGSIFENSQEAQSGMWPIMLLIIIPFFIALSMMKNPASPIAAVASMAPFASIIVMPAKMTLVDVPAWQLAVSFLINVATLYIIFPIAGRIYRVGILRTGKKPTWTEVVKWIKYKN